jgi:hypothetical protein
MNRRLPIITVLAATAVLTAWAVVSFACDKSSAKTTAQTASATKGECNYSKTTAVTASATKSARNASKTTAVTADAKGMACCATATAVAAKANGECDYSKTSAVTAVTAAHEGCSVSKTTAVAAVNEGHGKVTALLTGSSCSSGKTSNTMASKSGCVICDENASCDERLTIAGAVTQVVPLKNGVMFVYTANVENKAHAVQAAVHRRNDRIAEIASTGGDVALCDGCKSMRGAMASGKLRREVVNVEGGSLTLVTSEVPSVVKALQEYSGVKSVKS